ncbi:lipoprotein [Leucobacter tardus]|uniref:ABC transporter n=1 Tax=Leucobacter tardus TaxID=501483 RepID=A0A939QMH7_9MICO|nr:ABC transporter [Leucobacter tardus]MBO2990636.1 ABC transporter [Leucobacter tardus]
MKLSRSLIALPLAVTCIALAGCATSAEPQEDAGTASGDGHGEVAGAAEVAEPPLGLVTVDAAGDVGFLDLLNEEQTALGSIGEPSALATDGRYAFASTPAGLEVVDSGHWTWDHVDHFHYYRADPRLVGTVPGEGPVTISTGMLSTAGSTGVFFSGSGEAVLLDNAALADGTPDERFRIDVGSDGGVVAPLGDGALVADGDTLVFHDASGAATESSITCADPSGSITTRVALAVGCADGAVLATASDDAVELEHVPFPDGVDAGAVTAFDARKGRPTVAALAADHGFWLLSTRDRAWTHVDTDLPLERAVAADDAEHHVVALDADGRVHVLDAETGDELAATESLVDEVSAGVSLTVDDQRAYLNDPQTGLVHEIDYAGDARVARTLEPEVSADFVAEVGR